MENWLRWVMVAALAAIGIVALDANLAGQEIMITMYGGAGGAKPNGLSATGGLRFDVSRTWGAYGRIGRRVEMMEECTASIPPYCSYPEGVAREYAVGVSRMGRAGIWRVAAVAGGGVLHWQHESDRFIDTALHFRRPLGTRGPVLLGLQTVMVPGLERERRGYDPIVQKKNVLLVDAVGGLSLQVW
jgi:hypothetical protein